MNLKKQTRYVHTNNLFGRDATIEKASAHWKSIGLPGGLAGSPHFHSRKYLQSNPDVREAYGEYNYPAAVSHFLERGFNETWRENGGTSCEYCKT